MAFKDQLNKLRKRKNITQTDLANKVGVKQYVVSSWETGRSEPNLDQLTRLSEILDVPTDYLLDKPVIKTSSEEEFYKVAQHIDQDIKDDYIRDISELCKNLPKEKKEKLLKVIRDIIEL